MLVDERQVSRLRTKKATTTYDHVVAETIERCSTIGKLLWERVLSEVIVTTATLVDQVLDVVDTRIRGEDGFQVPIVTISW